jgi:ribosomal protein S18 acetylase RimI-like enzyme
LVTDGRGLGRYQSVETHPDYRRRGLSAGVLHLAAEVGRTELGVERLVIVADPSYVAIDLYRALGFLDAERQVQWQRAPG